MNDDDKPSMATIQRWNDEMWNIYNHAAAKLSEDCQIEQEIVNDGAVWINHNQSPLISDSNHVLRVSMRYEYDFHYGVDEVDEYNTVFHTFEDGMIPDARPASHRLKKADELLSRYGCLS